jgi:hypothetical protein
MASEPDTLIQALNCPPNRGKSTDVVHGWLALDTVGDHFAAFEEAPASIRLA